MKNNNIVLLHKDGSVEVIKNESEILKKDCKYALIPIIGFDTFVIVKPKKIWDFTVAYIEYTLQYKYFYDDEMNYTNFKPVKTEIRGIVNLINFIHSLDRIDYTNYILNYEMRDNIILTDVENMKIKIFKDDNLIYNYKYEARYGRGYTDKSNCEDVLLELNELYLRKNKDIQYSNSSGFINIRSNKWSFDADPKIDCIVGINMLGSQSIYFTEKEIYDTVNLVRRIDGEASVFNRDEMPDEYRKKKDLSDPIDYGEIETYESFPIYIPDSSSMMEFLIYLKFIYTLIVMEYNFIIYDHDPINNPEGYDMFISLIIVSYNKRDASMVVTKDHIPTLEEFIKKIFNMRRD